MSGPRYITIHGHFYQPPRESPWLEAVEIQDSALPYHDWNARVTAECYAPNSAARRVNAENQILDIVNNFERISFNVGPTLCAWLERERPDVYARILDADRVSARAHDGHGNAIAQAYGHAILPLCSRRDKVTQVRWGLADFRRRFRREAEGMWLPETAVDDETLEVLAEEGVRFTILAPRQAAQVRERPDGAWEAVGAAIDPSCAYRYDAGQGRELAVFFYDGPISHAVAFEGLLRSGDACAARLLEGFDDRRPGAQLVHIATDGESYGHHHPFADMALAAACDRIEREAAVTLTNYGAFLAVSPPAAEVRIVAPSSWSCAHGVERWRADCGCNIGRAGWHQRWRAPLRAALDWLRDAVDPLCEARAAVLLKDPWAARDDYVHVVLDRSSESVAAFLDRHQRRSLASAERVQALKGLELQRHRLLMYTSCGWFFDEVSGLEAVQILRYAARVIQLARGLGGDADLEAAFLQRLQAVPSNVAELRNGEGVYQRHVQPAVVDLRRVIAHYAVTSPYGLYGDAARVYAYTVERLAWQRESFKETSLMLGRVRVTADVTGETEEATAAVLHFGGHDFHCAVRSEVDPAGFDRLATELFRRFGRHSLAEVVRALDEQVDARSYGIRDVFLEERRRLLTHVTEGVRQRLEETYRRVYAENRRLMEYLRELDAPQPEALAVAARYVLQRAIERELSALDEDDVILARTRERVAGLLAEARALGIEPRIERDPTAADLERALLQSVERIRAGVAEASLEEALTVLQLGRQLGVTPSLWAAQNRFFELWNGRRSASAGGAALAPLALALGFAPDAE